MKNKPTMVRWIAYFPEALLAELDKWAEKNGAVSRAEAMRTLLRRGLDASKPAPKRPAYPQDVLDGLVEVGADLEASDEVETLRKLIRMAKATNAPEDEPPAPKRGLARKLAGKLGVF